LDVPEAQLQTCFNTELNNCISNAASTEEATNFSNWLTCLQTCLQSAGGQNASNEDILQCYMYGCPDENAECHSGGTYGTENCLELTQCAACANTASSTECWRPCFEKATPDAINDFMAVQLCISDACAALPVAEQQACIQTALGAGGACETEGVKCEGGTTTEPAACEPACAEGETCVEGVCQADATEPAACEPACAEGETCVEGVCEAPACTPACSDVICSMDGCGGVCGACDATDMSTAVTIASFAFSPDSIKVAAGTTVIWTNEDSAQHNVVSMAADGSVDAAGVLNGPLLGQGESFSFTFSDAGSFDYRCAPHASMTGAVEVVAP
jgi:plastocyanin